MNDQRKCTKIAVFCYYVHFEANNVLKFQIDWVPLINLKWIDDIAVANLCV